MENIRLSIIEISNVRIALKPLPNLTSSLFRQKKPLNPIEYRNSSNFFVGKVIYIDFPPNTITKPIEIVFTILIISKSKVCPFLRTGMENRIIKQNLIHMDVFGKKLWFIQMVIQDGSNNNLFSIENQEKIELHNIFQSFVINVYFYASYHQNHKYFTIQFNLSLFHFVNEINTNKKKKINQTRKFEEK